MFRRAALRFVPHWTPRSREFSVSPYLNKAPVAVGPKDSKVVFKTPEQQKQEEALSGYITIDTPVRNILFKCQVYLIILILVIPNLKNNYLSISM
ncbi:hypothetical protein Anas_10695 [Armadillidium nasatum]|uniref:Uncharacterized protein n=1 Tax=Armadillidium nasatum TaxID=96803 RepID=A0A5N5TMN0_9CRUS|nr:hypothetical protein Anas_10695 [Armadillidium nasatum]